MSLLPFFRWCQETWIGDTIRSSTYLFPAIEVVHLLGLVALLGAILAVDLRLLGFGLRRQNSLGLAKEIAPLIGLGFATVVVTGSLLFLAEAVKCYENPAFWFKMYFLAAALVFHATLYRRVTSSDSPSCVAQRITAICSLLLWFGVAFAGRMIAFL